MSYAQIIRSSETRPVLGDSFQAPRESLAADVLGMYVRALFVSCLGGLAGERGCGGMTMGGQGVECLAGLAV